MYYVTPSRPLDLQSLPFFSGYRRASCTCPTGLVEDLVKGLLGNAFYRAWLLESLEKATDLQICKVGFLFGQRRDRGGRITRFLSQMCFNIRAQISHVIGIWGHSPITRLSNWLLVTQ
jgi:hypothetical protein